MLTENHEKSTEKGPENQTVNKFETDNKQKSIRVVHTKNKDFSFSMFLMYFARISLQK